MAGDLITLDVRTRGDWRRWLAKHHASSPGIWLIRHKQHAGVESMPYGDVVSEALCFGWIDSLIKRLDEKTREKRIRESIELLAAGKKLGLK